MPRRTLKGARGGLTPPVKFQVPEPPKRNLPAPPPWEKDQGTFGQPHKTTVRQAVVDVEWFLPPFQREVVWTPAQQAAYCNSLWDGMPTAPLLVWERDINGTGWPYRRVVLDGQQRLTALGAHVIRADGTVGGYNWGIKTKLALLRQENPLIHIKGHPREDAP